MVINGKANVEDVITEIKQKLEDELDDPNPARKDSVEWIETEALETDINQYPRIHIHRIDTLQDSLSVGRTERQKTQGIQINIFNHVHGEFDVDGDNELESSRQVLHYLNQRIETIINDNQSTWCGIADNIWSIVTVNDQPLEGQSSETDGHTLELELQQNT